MKSSQTGMTTALAVLLAVSLVLFGRLLSSGESTSEARVTSALANARIAFLSNPMRDRVNVNIVRVDENGRIVLAGQQGVRFNGWVPRIELANNGTLLTHDMMPVGTTNLYLRHVASYQLSMEATNCQFASISPNGKWVACVMGREVKVSPTDRPQWRAVRTGGEQLVFGAPRLFNETILVTDSVQDQTSQYVVSLINNATLAYLDPEAHYAFNRAGTHAATLDATSAELTLLDILNEGEATSFALPMMLQDDIVRVVALSDDAKQVLLYVESVSCSAVQAQMVVWNLDTQALTWLSGMEAPASATGEFDPTGRMVTYAIGRSIYLASISDGRSHWVSFGTQPVWLAR